MTLSSNPPEPLDLKGGDSVGNYRLVGLLGRGGFASVWRAQSARGEFVALKVLEAVHLANADNVRRFEAEAALLSRLKHPNIAKVVETFVHESRPAIAMELVEGRSLRDELVEWSQNGKRLEWAVIGAILREILSALSHAHDQGVIHRDLKPANILRPSGMLDNRSAVLLDFGVAKILGRDRADETTMGRAIGTTQYMSPEQFDDSRGMTPASDLFAAGVLLFELATLRRTWARGAQGELASCHDAAALYSPENGYAPILGRVIRGARPKILAFRGDAPAGLQELFESAVAVDTAKRPASAAAFIASLDGILGVGTTAPTRGPWDATARDTALPASLLEELRGISAALSGPSVTTAPMAAVDAGRTMPDQAIALNVPMVPADLPPSRHVPSTTPYVMPSELSDPEDGPPTPPAPRTDSAPRLPPQPTARRQVPFVRDPSPLVGRARVAGAVWSAAGGLGLGGATGGALSALHVAAPTLAIAAGAGAAVVGAGAALLSRGWRRRRAFHQLFEKLNGKLLFRWSIAREVSSRELFFEGQERQQSTSTDSVHLAVSLRITDPSGIHGAPIRVEIEKKARSNVKTLMAQWEKSLRSPIAPSDEGELRWSLLEIASRIDTKGLGIGEEDLGRFIQAAATVGADHGVFTKNGLRLVIFVPAATPGRQLGLIHEVCTLFSMAYAWAEVLAAQERWG